MPQWYTHTPCINNAPQLTHVEGLDTVTQPAYVLSKLQERCPEGSTLFLATNEKDEHFFDLLKEHYTVYTYRYAPCGGVERVQWRIRENTIAR